jgi:hypothetical protein
MATKERRYVSTMSSIQALENRCNFDELNIPGKLRSLKAGTDTTGVKVTLAIYEIIEEPEGVGNLDLRKDENATDSAWIMTVETPISIVRP